MVFFRKDKKKQVREFIPYFGMSTIGGVSELYESEHPDLALLEN